jgi:hypothetical protein
MGDLIAGPDGFWVDADAGLVYRDPLAGALGHNHGGYLRIGSSAEGRVFAHRVVWEAVNGPIPDGLEVNHINGIKDDNRIANLEVVTVQENLAHAWRLGLRQPPPFPYGETHPCAKLTTADILAIRAASEVGVPRAAIAARFGIGKQHVTKIAKRRAWAHVPSEAVT